MEQHNDYLGPEALNILKTYRDNAYGLLHYKQYTLSDLVEHYEDLAIRNAERVAAAEIREPWHFNVCQALDTFVRELKMHQLLGTMPQPQVISM